MTTILHLSDVHFGHTDPVLVESLLAEIAARAPDLVVISGDFTQEGLPEEFQEARAFIDKIKVPVFTIPGNHDIPRYNLWQRFTDPMARYRKYINPETSPVLETDTLMIVGLNTARPIVPHWNWAHGMVAHKQILRTDRLFKAAAPGKCRIFVCHHPLLVASGAPLDTIVWRADQTMKMLADCQVDMVLTGHIHHASVTMAGIDSQLVSVGAGTATSTRLRLQANGYNLIKIQPDHIEINLMHREDGKFITFQTHTAMRNHAPPHTTSHH